ncbi:MAG: prepilin-type N-terminal cleavage/methylation domain-containing protein [Sedimentisphaerales bacterium]|nr:prepilin-type N-terminal cleavage/methylation domain-containing protein [Sedimentisphaerales bacterium]
MILKSRKFDFVPLKERKVFAPNSSFRDRPSSGFTLIEVLVAVTIIATIASMVYGSYFATAKSADIYKARMTVSGQSRKILNQMSRQIRCAYIRKVNKEENKDSAETDLGRKNEILESPVIYFSYESEASDGGILNLVTTHKLFCEDEYTAGLFDVAYKFDKNFGTLYLSQRKFTGTSEGYSENRNWRPILRNVESVELSFFDGDRWNNEWDFKQKRELPFAVKIGITCMDENDRQCCYGTIACLDCSELRKPKVVTEETVVK